MKKASLVSSPANDFTYTFDLLEDGLAGGDPDERVGLCVVGGDEGLDMGADQPEQAGLDMGDEGGAPSGDAGGLDLGDMDKP